MKYEEQLTESALAELNQIATGSKPYLTPDQWRPVAYAARAPQTGVTLDGGPLRTCFERNIAYLNEWWAKTDQWQNPIEEKNWWVSCLTASSEGRMLAAAAHTLRWVEREDMRRIVEQLVDMVKTRQRADGYCLPYDESFMAPQDDFCYDERRNYDRVNLTRGMIAAANIGYPEALTVMRKFHDWLYASPYCAKLLIGAWDATAPKHNVKNGRPGMGTAHNCNNGHEGSLLMYFSPAGKPEDLVAVERYFVQDFMLDACRKREPLCLSHYPLHVAHSYVFLAFKAWLDHYRATGAEKYIEGAKGAWDIVFRHYRHIGSSAAICETVWGTYPPDSRFIRWDEDHHTGENCGSVFWADINHRLLQFFPEEEKYAGEIEQTIFNCTLANQVATGHIRYHARLEDRKAAFTSINTCCEVMGSPFIASLPQYIYSVADDGLYVNLFVPSAIAWNNVSVKQETAFPFAGGVKLKVAGASKRWKLRVRVPGWVDAAVTFAVNGERVATGQPGGYVTIDRDWREGDEVSFDLPLKLRTEKYTGRDEVPGRERHALFLGPVMLALVGSQELNMPVGQLLGRLRVIDGKPLHYTVEDVFGVYYMPYWQIDKELFACFPLFT
jgi:hypothetical protein